MKSLWIGSGLFGVGVIGIAVNLEPWQGPTLSATTQSPPVEAPPPSIRPRGTRAATRANDPLELAILELVTTALRSCPDEEIERAEVSLRDDADLRARFEAGRGPGLLVAAHVDGDGWLSGARGVPRELDRGGRNVRCLALAAEAMNGKRVLLAPPSGADLTVRVELSDDH